MGKYKYSREGYLTIEEVEQMIVKSRPYMKGLIAFLYLFGCRVSEALQLRKKDFQIQDEYLTVTIPILKRRKQTGPIATKHELTVNLNAPFTEHIISRLAEKTDQEKVWDLHRNTVGLRIKEVNPNCSPHFFRHSRLVNLARKGASGPELRDFAGWTDLRPVDKYVAVTGQLAKKYADQID